MGNVTGALSKVIGWTETTWNTTPGSPDARRIPLVSFGVTDKTDRETDPTLSGFRGQQRSTEGKTDVGGAISVVAAPEDIGFWLAHTIGKPATTGSGPYVHTFAVDPTGSGALPAGMGFEVDYGAGISGAGRYVVYSGCRVKSLKMAFPANGNITLQVDVVGAGVDADNVATVDSSPTDTGHNAWKAQKATWVFDSGSLSVCLESCELTIDNDLDTERWCVGNDGIRHDLPEGQFILSGAGVAYFDTAALLNKAAADTDAALVVTLTKGTGAGTAGNETLEITIPALAFSREKPAIDGPRGLKQNFTFTTHRTTGEIAVEAVLTNALATVY